MSKYFVVDNSVTEISKEELSRIAEEDKLRHAEVNKKHDALKKSLLTKKHELKHVEGRVVIVIDIDNKNWWTFEDGTKIRYERQFDNMNRRETEPVNAIVVDAENIPSGSEILIHPNAVQDSYRIFNYTNVSKEAGDIRYYSIPEEQCFIWKDNNGEWMPLKPYEKALRVFKPYKGTLEGIAPTQLKDTLYVLTGELKGKVVKTIKASDYMVIFQDTNGKEGNLIRFRPNGDEKHNREPEAIAILNNETQMVNNGELLVGTLISNAKTIN